MVLADWQTDYLVNKTPYEGRTATTQSGAAVACTGDSVLVVDDSEVYTSTFNNGEMGELTKQDNGTESQAYKATHPAIPTGFEHTEGEWNTGYVIKEKATNDEFVWIPVINEASYVRKSGSKNMHITALNVKDYDIDVTQYVLGDKLGLPTILGVTITETERSGETPANIPEAEVVNAAGGFYVSRYEIGIKTRIADTTGNSNQTTADWTKENFVSQAGKEPARNITQPTALSAANSWKNGEADETKKTVAYQSGLITGTQWDAMCNFIGWSICDTDTTTWGNLRSNLSKNLLI